MMEKLQLGSAFWIDKQNHGLFGKGRIELLKNIDIHGSLAKAAKAMNMSYKAAWDSMKEMENLSNETLTQKSTGGKGGGGSTLTPKARQYIALFEALQSAQKSFFESVEPHLDDARSLMQLLSRPAIRTSARNQIEATLESITPLHVNTKLTLRLDADRTIEAHITHSSVADLGLSVGQKVYGIIKASWLTLHDSPKECNQNHNILEGTVIAISSEEEMLEITLMCAEQALVATGVAQNFPLCKKGDTLWASFDPSDVIIGC
jgi:molybdate transport system regulatory protein